MVITSSSHAKIVNKPILSLKKCSSSGVKQWIYQQLLFYVAQVAWSLYTYLTDIATGDHTELESILCQNDIIYHNIKPCIFLLFNFRWRQVGHGSMASGPPGSPATLSSQTPGGWPPGVSHLWTEDSSLVGAGLPADVTTPPPSSLPLTLPGSTQDPILKCLEERYWSYFLASR